MQLERHALCQKCSEALPRRAAEFLTDAGLMRVAMLFSAHQMPTEPRANTAVRVLNRLWFVQQGKGSIAVHRIFERRYIQTGLLLRRHAIRLGNRHNQEWIHS